MRALARTIETLGATPSAEPFYDLVNEPTPQPVRDHAVEPVGLRMIRIEMGRIDVARHDRIAAEHVVAKLPRHAGGAIVALSRYLTRPGNAEHPAPDLALDKPHNDGSQRAPEAFRPDPTAPVPESERDGLRPATGPAPTLVRGSTVGG